MILKAPQAKKAGESVMDAGGEPRKTTPHILELWESASTPMLNQVFGHVKDASLVIQDGTTLTTTDMVNANGQKHQIVPVLREAVTILVAADAKPLANPQLVCRGPQPMANLEPATKSETNRRYHRISILRSTIPKDS